MPNATTTGIGATLRSARETLGVSVEEAAWKTRIRPEYLRALEEERFDACGHLEHGRAHLHSYARFLGLDANALVGEYTTHVEHAEPSPIEQLNERSKEAFRPPKPNWLIAAGVAAVLLIAASLAGIVRGPGPRTNPTSVRESMPTLPASDQASPPASSPAGVAGAVPAKSVTLVLVAEGRSWVRVVSDGKLLFEGTLTAGVQRTFSAEKEIDLTIGNAGVVRLILNGHDLGNPGHAGQIYRAKLGPQGATPSK